MTKCCELTNKLLESPEEGWYLVINLILLFNLKRRRTRTYDLPHWAGAGGMSWLKLVGFSFADRLGRKNELMVCFSLQRRNSWSPAPPSRLSSHYGGPPRFDPRFSLHAAVCRRLPPRAPGGLLGRPSPAALTTTSVYTDMDSIS